MRHICISNLTIIGSNNGLLPDWHQTIIWTDTGILLIEPLGKNFSDILTHWGRVMHICISELTIIGSDNGLSPRRCQAIIWNNAGLLLIEPLGTNVSEISIGIQTFTFKKMHLNMSSVKWRLFCLCLNVLIEIYTFSLKNMHFSSGKWQPFCLVLNVLNVSSLVLGKSWCRHASFPDFSWIAYFFS